jgi:photosystem II stability/assembly factor-like uncharacterized protein
MKNFVLLTVFIFTVFSQNLSFNEVSTNLGSSFRGLSVVDDNIAWLSGSNAWIGRTFNGGKNWVFVKAKGYEKLEFRSIYAFDEKTAIIANVGSPAYILRTVDAGENWSVVYTNTEKDAFFDGVDFWNNKEGFVYGDPINGKMLLVGTTDAGLTWKEFKSAPNLNEGEASFAASSTGIRCLENGNLLIATGGKTSRLFSSTNKGQSFTAITAPIIQGENATGIFSVAFNKKNLIIVGGDYTKDTLGINHHFYSNDYGKTWKVPTSPVRSYRETVEFISDKIILSIGPRGTDVSYDGGENYTALSSARNYHSLRKARKGSLIIACGGNGQIAVIK